jgi:hypothetical protein
MQPWVNLNGPVDCGSCPRIVMRPPTYLPCTGAQPRRKPTTLSADIYLPPGATSGFTWDFGDGQSQAVPPVTNTASNANTPVTVSVTHDYAETASPLQACLLPQNRECPSVCVTVDASCTPGGCPVPTVTTSFGACGANNAVPVTFTIALSPPVPAGAAVACTLVFGGTSVQGQQQVNVPVNTAGGSVASVSHTESFVRAASGYSGSVTVSTIVNGQLCQQSRTFTFNPQPCIACPDPQNPVTIVVQVPNSAAWCAPVAPNLAATFTASVNWSAPQPSPAPVPVRFDWTVTLPSGAGTATQSTTAPTVGTGSGWNGPGAGSAGGGINLSQAGTYAVSVTAVFPPNAGLPTDMNGVVTCNTTAPASFRLDPCDDTRQCPTLTDLTLNPGCISGSTPATVSATAAVDDPSGSASGFDWNFGDPGSQGNQVSTATSNATHDYASPGTYTVTARLRSSDPACPRPAATFSRTVTVANCPPPPPPVISETNPCAILLWVSMIAMLVGLVTAIVGCLISVFGPPQVGVVVGVIGLIIFAIGLICFVIWLILCQSLTACSVLLAVLDFVRVMIVVFGIIMAIVAFFLIGSINAWPCLVGAAISWGWWGVVLSILVGVAERAGCLVRQPNAGAGSSSSPLTGSSTRPRQYGTLRVALPFLPVPAVGLGSALSKAGSLLGVQPCAPCKERAALLDRMVELRRPGQ